MGSAILLKVEAREMGLLRWVMSAIPPKAEAREMGLLRSVMSAIPPKAEAKEMALLKFLKEESLGTGRLRQECKHAMVVAVEIVVCSSSKLLMTPLLVILRVLFCSK